ncbi:MAG TPA: LPS export ABC transporter periplasmic protein LptC, partial [Candidatus Nitrosotenuis sp.]|nr:LPS export ABC transporter periplasmic protein LptC [Candidatus Nitrosotenuis sp.]
MRNSPCAPHLVLGLVLLVAAWLGSACGAPPPQGAAPEASPSGARGASPAARGSEAQDFERTTIKSHTGHWVLEADRAVFDRQVDEGRVYNIVWTLLDKEGRPRLVARAREAEVDAKKEQVFFIGQVVARGSKGEVLVANKMHYDG